MGGGCSGAGESRIKLWTCGNSQDDNPWFNLNQGFLLGGGGGGGRAGQGYSACRGVGGEFRSIIVISDTIYHPYIPTNLI